MFEDVDLNETEVSRGVKFVISGVNWTMCRPNVDDYNHAISRLMQGMRDRGVLLQQVTFVYCQSVNNFLHPQYRI